MDVNAGASFFPSHLSLLMLDHLPCRLLSRENHFVVEVRTQSPAFIARLRKGDAS
jgi:hypothetical protein